MAVPARPEPARPPAAEPAWAAMLATQVAAMRAAVEELARRPKDKPALEAARLNLAVAENLADLARRQAFCEERLAAERRLGYAEGMAAARAARRLGVVPDPG